jgi:hypothetical protein
MYKRICTYIFWGKDPAPSVLAKEAAAVQKQAYLGDILNHPQNPSSVQ